jgi:holo-[acyl-carrier protein] synthase
MNLRFGLDLVPVASVAESLADQGSRYVDRIYTRGEIADSQGAHGIDPRRLAERFAVKEATLKILPLVDEGLDFRSIELVCEPAGRLGVALHGRAAEIAESAGIGHIAVSVTRDARLAVAVVAAEVTAEVAAGAGASDADDSPLPTTR